MSKVSVLPLLGCVVTAFVLSSCQLNTPDTTDPVVLGDETLENYNISPAPSAQNGGAATNQSQAQTQRQATTNPVPTPVPTKPEKGPMKSLTDFEQIPATKATLVTSKGEITFDLYRDQAPITTANFLSLAKSGFYNGIVFHRVIADFMAQVGDPLTKDASKKAMWGSGGPGYVIPDEFGAGLSHTTEGVVSMANSGPNTGGSQFFITYGPTTWLDGKHAIFGKVTQGMDVLRQIQVGDTIESVTFSE